MKLTKMHLVLVLAGSWTGPLVGQAPAPETIVASKELFITAQEVVNSDRAKKQNGPWHIRTALQRIAGNKDGIPVDLEGFAQAWFKTWADNAAIEGVDDTFTRRPWVAEALVKAWKEDRIRLIAIVNRLDLTKFPNNDSTQPPIRLGEGRFVYEVMADATNPEPFTLIFEYRLPGDSTLATLQQWAKEWHKLGQSAALDEDYLKILEGITNRYSAHGTLNQIRTNEFLDVPAGQKHEWELREFHFNAAKQNLEQVTVALTPAFKFNDQEKLRQFVQTEAVAIIGGKHEAVPSDLIAAVAPVPTPSFTWKIFNAGATQDFKRAGFIVSFNTCSGCHAGDTGTLFQHIGRNAPDLSPFLKGPITLAQKLPGQNSSQHNEMQIRVEMLRDFLAGPSSSDDPQLKANVKARAMRVH